MSVRDKPHYTLLSGTLAQWIENQPDKWWSVDGDPLLTSVLDFPCPSDELAPTLRNIDKSLLLQDRSPTSRAKGEPLPGDRLNELADAGGKSGKKVLRLAWRDSNTDWLLIEDDALVAK